MSIVFKFTADNSDVVQKLGEIKEQMSWTEFSMCAPSVLGLRSQAKKARTQKPHSPDEQFSKKPDA